MTLKRLSGIVARRVVEPALHYSLILTVCPVQVEGDLGTAISWYADPEPSQEVGHWRFHVKRW